MQRVFTRLQSKRLFSRRTFNKQKNFKGFKRNFNSGSTFSKRNVSGYSVFLLGGLLVGGTLVVVSQNVSQAGGAPKVDYNAVKKDIIALLNNEKYDDGSYGPVLVRLAWHASGTYDKSDGTGGSNGASMRFKPESGHGANAGLDIARNLLEPVKKKYPGISYADLWTLAGAVAIESMGGPKIPWKPGRSDGTDSKSCPPDGRLPDASKGAPHVREVFYRMGFNDQEIVALIGAHVLGRMHTNRSGYDGPWTRSPTTFSNDFFVQLKENKWVKKKWRGPEEFVNENGGDIAMNPADLAFLSDPKFKKYVDLYAENEEKFFDDFAKAFGKLLELGVKFK
jgi:cytochrome c peroxidase